MSRGGFTAALLVGVAILPTTVVVGAVVVFLAADRMWIRCASYEGTIAAPDSARGRLLGSDGEALGGWWVAVPTTRGAGALRRALVALWPAAVGSRSGRRPASTRCRKPAAPPIGSAQAPVGCERDLEKR